MSRARARSEFSDCLISLFEDVRAEETAYNLYAVPFVLQLSKCSERLIGDFVLHPAVTETTLVLFISYVEHLIIVVM